MKTLKTCVSVLLSAAALCGLGGCRIMADVRENAERLARIEILDTPADLSPGALYAAALENGVNTAAKIEESVSLSVSDPAVTPAKEDAPALLGEAAKQLASLIMGQDPKPGASSRELTAEEARGCLLFAAVNAKPLDTVPERDMLVENVTDEHGNQRQDEEGNAVTETRVSDNLLRISYRFYIDPEQPEADENAQESDEAKPPRECADREEILRVFGPERDPEAVYAGFEALKDYLQIRDYTLEYTDTDSSVNAEIDLAENRLNSASFHRDMLVTAEVTGLGALAAYGDFTVTFRLSEDTNYTLHYEETAE